MAMVAAMNVVGGSKRERIVESRLGSIEEKPELEKKKGVLSKKTEKIGFV